MLLSLQYMVYGIISQTQLLLHLELKFQRTFVIKMKWTGHHTHLTYPLIDSQQ